MASEADPVSEALRVAASRLQTDADIWCSDHAADLASTAIAAFLRALPAPYWQDDQPAFGDLAAAVERAASAAREGRDGG